MAIEDFNNSAKEPKFGGFAKKNTKIPKPSAGKALKIIGIIAGVIFVLVLIGNSVYTIQEEEQAVVCTFGVAKAVTEPGIHFKVPIIQTVRKVNTTIQGFAIGYSDDYGQNYDAAAGPDESMMITSDYNFIQIDFYVEYRVTDPVKALYASTDPKLVLANLAQNCIRTTIGSYGVDAVLTTGKNEIQSNIKDMILDKLDALDIGIQLVNITIQDAEPPTEEVVTAFKSVETAKQGKETALNNANKYRNEQIPKAQAEADKILQDAEAEKEGRINEAVGQVARFDAMYEEYVKYPTITKQRMFYETMEEVLPDLKVIIEGSDGSNVSQILPLGSFEGAGNTAAAAAGASETAKGIANDTGSTD